MPFGACVSSSGGALTAYGKDSKSSAVWAQLDYLVIDEDGHWLAPVLVSSALVARI
jgi:hypothetical protein